MNQPAITLEVLPASCDCLLVSCTMQKRSWRLLVATGPDETYPALRSRLLKIPPDAQGARHIDLFVVSHIDHDHIGAAALLLRDKELNLRFGDVWFNAPPRPVARGVAEGERLADILGADAAALPWNRAFEGELAVTAGPGAVRAVPLGPDQPRLTLLSPTPQRLTSLFKVWDRELAKLRAGKSNEHKTASAAAARGAAMDLEALAARHTPVDRAAPNGSSIALLLEHRGSSVLLGADAFPDVLAAVTLSQLSGPFGYRADRHDWAPDEGPGACREEKQVHRRADRLCAEAAGAGGER